jgi:hypothetical protein
MQTACAISTRRNTKSVMKIAVTDAAQVALLTAVTLVWHHDRFW